MADRRMLTRKVTDDDRFMELSSSAQALYMHLNMSADDDGFNSQVSIAMFRAHASIQDLEALLAKRFILQFENGVIVIKHWRMANALRKDRYTPTVFKEELARLNLKDNGAYTERLPDGCHVVANGLPDGCLRIDKSSLNQVIVREGEERKELGECEGEGKTPPPPAGGLSGEAREKRIAELRDAVRRFRNLNFDAGSVYRMAAAEGISPRELDAEEGDKQ